MSKSTSSEIEISPLALSFGEGGFSCAMISRLEATSKALLAWMDSGFVRRHIGVKAKRLGDGVVAHGLP